MRRYRTITYGKDSYESLSYLLSKKMSKILYILWTIACIIVLLTIVVASCSSAEPASKVAEKREKSQAEVAKEYLKGWSKAKHYSEEELEITLYKGWKSKNKHSSWSPSPGALVQNYMQRHTPNVNPDGFTIYRVWDDPISYFVHPKGVKEIESGEWD